MLDILNLFRSSRIKFIALTGALSVTVLSALLMVVAVLGPVMGLGKNEGFLLYRFLGLSRSDTLTMGLTFFIPMAIISSLLVMSEHSQRRMGAWIELGRVLFRPIYAEKLSWLWRVINGNWVVAICLAPFALFILALWVLAMPPGPWVAPDSMGYLTFNPQRTLGYPVFMRLVAVFHEDPSAIIAVQLALGLLVTITFSEVAQRLFRNVLVTMPTGIFILFNWPLLEHAFYLLSDYPMSALVCLQFAFVLGVLLEPKPSRFIAVALVTGLAVAIRPIGIVLFLAVPFFLVVYPRLWRRTALSLVVPLVALVALQMTANWLVFDYFALSRFSGYPLAANTAYLLRNDTPSEHPELVRRLVDYVRPYQEDLAKLEGRKERYLHVVNTTNPIIGNVGKITMQYGREKGIVEESITDRQKAFVTFLNGLSKLNREFGRLGIYNAPHWNWLDRELQKLAVSAHLHNPGMFLDLTWLKLGYSWQQVLPYSLAPVDFSYRRGLRLDDAGFGFQTPDARQKLQAPWGWMVRAFNVVAKVRFLPERVLPLPWVVLAICLFVGALFLVRAIRIEPISPQMAGLAYLAMCVVVYHLAVSVAQVPIGRFMIVVLPAPMLLLFSPLLLISWGGRMKMNKIFKGPA